MTPEEILAKLKELPRWTVYEWSFCLTAEAKAVDVEDLDKLIAELEASIPKES